MKDYDNFFLPVDDITSAKDYYMNTLGLPLKFDFSNQGMIAFNVGNNEPALILKDRNKFKDAKPTTWFVVEDVNTEYEKMKSNGVNFLSSPFPIRTGMAVEFEDPFGNRLGITDYTMS
ncbi:VOC family protein [Clostridium sp. YIM B02505]|uniref:VOC family protein n=1 Tax=Clostridium yunnanense TaxID=2800325 RepID=A0ABS1ESI7_9CLOT|nr:VOC family protein [Clostridium yunnanense]MBK1812349.1 VOC family protein [Clostridium yunnanense]